jgi:uncharacterized secreted protein with C-terminal beta-propeller domain
MSSRSVLCVTLAISAAALGGCTADRQSRPTPPPRPAPAMRLAAFDSCQQLRNDLRKAAAASIGPYGFAGAGPFAEPAVIAGGARTALDSAAEKAAPGPAFSGTNVHEADADEPDIVKTDGKRIVTVADGRLREVDAATRRAAGSLDLGEDAAGEVNLLLAGDKALVLVSGGYGRYRVGKIASPVDDGPRLLLVDLTGTPRVISTYRGEGMLVDARQTGSTARVVLRSAPRISLPDPMASDDDPDRVAANREAVSRAPVGAWLPAWSVTTDGVTERGSVGCGQVSRPSDYSAGAMLTILTFDLGAARLDSGRPIAIVADGETVYGTGTSLYVANDQRWRLDVWRGGRAGIAPRDTPEQKTEIYRFDTPAGQPPRYAAAGAVPGWLVNQYALSEWDGHLRVATTDDRAGSSAVRVLAQKDGDLTQVGVVDGLGKGERIYSVRFVGPRGYVVTFKQTDPLYSVDLSDPEQPRVTGALKITGYSAHLQPAGEDQLIGIGQEASEQGRVQGTQVSLFDVGDPADPRRLAQYHVADGQSAAEWDPHALLWWPATRLLVVPMMGSAVALRVSDAGLTPVGTIRQDVQRSLVIGDTLWTMSGDGMRASSLSTMDQLAWVPNS